jgi:methionyl aminopeptidase
MEEYAINCYIRAGKIAAQIKKFAKEFIKKDMKLIDIALAIDDKIKELGAVPAFPVNLSIDEVAAHFTPAIGEDKKAFGLLKVDIGIAIDGYIADTAFTLDFTEDNKHFDMVHLNKVIQQNIIDKLRASSLVRDVGNIVQDTLEEWNEKNNKKYSIIKSLSGHQVGQNVIHAGLTISNYRNNNENALKDKVVAIEPFVTTGDGDIYEGKGGGIYALSSNELPRDKEARVLVGFIKENYKTRPFCSRWLEKAGLKKVRYFLSLLEKLRIIKHYPLLIEKSKGFVSQEENTFLVLDDRVIVTTRED